MDDVRLALRMVVDGMDFEPPDKLLGNIKPDQACAKLPGWPYSIATNVAHADHWQRIWLAGLQGTVAPKAFPDFPLVSEAGWPEVRDRFVANCRLSLQIAEAEPFVHHAKSEESARRKLLQIAVHNSYHLGQVKLLKRLLRATKA